MNAAKSSTATGTTGTAEPRGRFAPSPTGPLHAGSLYAALGSWLDARAAGGAWLVRIEDVDRARERPGAADSILGTLEAFGLHWDGPVLRQSSRAEAYAEALRRLQDRGLVYPCSCTRGELPPAPAGEEARYPGTCLHGPRRPGDALALRFRASEFSGPVTAVDRLLGPSSQNVAATVGDFVLRRKDGFWAYQLAVVVDDAFQGITDVVRGRDLLDNTPRQILLQRTLGLPPVRYLHLPLVTDVDGAKLSKSAGALAADPATAADLLNPLLERLGLQVPADLARAPVADRLRWAVSAWDPIRLVGTDRVSPP